MAKRLLVALAVLAALAAVAGWVLTRPRPLDAADLPAHEPDLANGERMFWAGGCTACHAPNRDAPLRLAGGPSLKSPFGTFYAPNISPDPETGIGAWRPVDFVNAVQRGIGVRGEHLYPALPYTSYQRMRVEDVLDLFAYLKTLEPVRNVARPHDLPFPFNIRRGLGLWKLLYVDGRPFRPDPQASEEVNRGAYLVIGPGHCGECHTPRDRFGGMMVSRWLAGGPSPDGEGVIPNITPSPDGIGSWSVKDIVEALKSGFTPDFDSLGGPMAAVVRDTSHLPETDLRAIAAYLKSIPPIAGKPKKDSH